MITARLDNEKDREHMVVVGLTQKDFDEIGTEVPMIGFTLSELGIVGTREITFVVIRGANEADLRNQVMTKFGGQ